MNTPTPSPCVRNCCLNEQDICLGCFRSLQEIILWSKADEETRKTIVQAAHERRQATYKPPGGKNSPEAQG